MRRVHVAGFTLLELLIVVGTIGIIALIATPNLLNALQRGKQKRTVSDIRTVGMAVEAYASDNGRFVVAADGATIGDLAPSLVPTYVQALAPVDAWGYALQYRSNSAGSQYTIASFGKDGIPSGPPSGAITDFRHDVVFSMGSFVSWPDGTQN